ncbi:MAG: aminotransferase class V-fold PLP-dependent enzyme, partial [Clostridiales Family XIII bacterium]|nr:aminotransferase class V-fold PLP-dependent enzyme [Clostridiales Family XIII bacterium]
MKLFTLGPVEMYPETLALCGRPLPYFRTQAFSDIVLDCARRLKRLTGAPAGSEVFFLTASGTGAMEAAVANLFDRDDHLCIVDGGSFGHRFTEICARHGIPYSALFLPFSAETMAGAAEPGAAEPDEAEPDEERLRRFVRAQARGTGFLINLHETSTGRLYDLAPVSELCRERDMLLVVDAISAFLADELDMAGSGIDVLILSTQKALALPPGMSAVILSPDALRRMNRVRPFSLYFDFKDYAANGARGQTPFTPAVGILMALQQRLLSIEQSGGAAASIRGISALAADFRARARMLPAALPRYPLSNACTPLLFPRGGAAETYRILAQEYDVWLNPNGGEHKDRILRVGHLGNLTESDNAM